MSHTCTAALSSSSSSAKNCSKIIQELFNNYSGIAQELFENLHFKSIFSLLSQSSQCYTFKLFWLSGEWGWSYLGAAQMWSISRVPALSINFDELSPYLPVPCAQYAYSNNKSCLPPSPFTLDRNFSHQGVACFFHLQAAHAHVCVAADRSTILKKKHARTLHVHHSGSHRFDHQHHHAAKTVAALT